MSWERAIPFVSFLRSLEEVKGDPLSKPFDRCHATPQSGFKVLGAVLKIHVL